jgi:ligand-binding sensor domain-containing protein
MYIATSEGIIIFNGTTEYFVKGSESIGNQRVSCMIEDKNGVIWIGCANGSIYKIINKILFHWQPKFNLPRKKISRMAIDGQNQLWFSTKGDGIYCYTGKYVYRFTEENGLIHNDINDMVYVRETGVVVSSDLGIQVLKCTNQIEIENATRFSCLHNNEIVQDLIEGNGYIGMNNLVTGIEIWNYYSDCCYNIWNNSLSELIITLSITKNYQAIVTTDHFYLKYPGEKDFSKMIFDLNFAEIQSIEIDNSNTLWILHKNEGLLSVFLPVSQFTIDNKVVQGIATDKNEDYLLLCTDSCLQIHNTNDGRFISRYFEGQNLTSIYHDSSEDVFWIGTYGDGLIRFKLDAQEYRRYSLKEGLPDDNILHITGNANFIWVATLGGILRFNTNHSLDQLSEVVVYNHENELPTHFIYQIESDSSDRIWIATDGNGIYYLDKDAFCFEKLEIPAGNLSIYNIALANNNVLYFNASGKGLGYLDLGSRKVKWLNFYNTNIEYDCLGLINDTVIIAAADGVLLQTGKNESIGLVMDEEFGISKFSPSLNAIYKDKFSNVWIGGKNCVLRLRTHLLNINQKPKNSFLSIKILDKDILQDPGDSVFQYSENQISFEFSAIHFLASDHLDYRYKLEGYDLDWIYSKEGKENYSKLSPGKYRFVFQSSINGAYDPAYEKAYSFVILKPFWTTWWFISLATLILIVVIYLWVRFREKRKLKDQENRRKTSELEFELLKSQVNPHFLFNSFNTVISLMEDDKSRAIEFTEKLSDYFRNILKYRDIQLISIKEELDILFNYMELLELRHPEQILFETGPMNTDALIAPLTLQLLMENALKHNEISFQHPLKIKVYCTGNVIVFTNTILRKKSNIVSTGFGLESLRARYQLMTEQKIKVEKLSDKFVVEIPLLN